VHVLTRSTKQNEVLKALIDMQFLRIYSYPLATLSTGTLAERQAQLAAFPWNHRFTSEGMLGDSRRRDFRHSEVLGRGLLGRKTT
jgi:hypothetical protein